jgi:hypothetical protein
MAHLNASSMKTVIFILCLGLLPMCMFPQISDSSHLRSRAKQVREIGIVTLGCGAVIAGAGYGYILIANSPGYKSNNATGYNSYYAMINNGVFYCVVGGILCIYGIIQLSRSAFFLIRSKNITLTPSGQNIGIVLNF